MLIPYVPRIESKVVAVWDLDETLASVSKCSVTYRMDLIGVIWRLKELGCKNILWTRGNLIHLVDVIAGTLLEVCFDVYLWDEHCDECYLEYGKHKHPGYIGDEYRCIIIDDQSLNCDGWDNFVCIKGLGGSDNGGTSAEYVYQCVARLFDGSH